VSLAQVHPVSPLQSPNGHAAVIDRGTFTCRCCRAFGIPPGGQSCEATYVDEQQGKGDAVVAHAIHSSADPPPRSRSQHSITYSSAIAMTPLLLSVVNFCPSSRALGMQQDTRSPNGYTSSVGNRGLTTSSCGITRTISRVRLASGLEGSTSRQLVLFFAEGMTFCEIA
jgi:hypothetical protein